jgi:small subunit ribosomal protein S6
MKIFLDICADSYIIIKLAVCGHILALIFRMRAICPKGGANMAKVTANYEVVYIIDPAQGEEGIATLVANFKTLAEQNGSAVEVEEWGNRKLAYPINYKNDGYYVLMSFTSEPAFPRELDRKLRIADGIMRSLIVCKGE